MKRFLLGLVATLIFLAACQQPAGQPGTPQQPQLPPEQTPEALPEAPVEAPAEEPLEQPEGTDIEEIESGLDKAFGPVDESQIITIDDVVCNFEERTLTFRFRNTEEKSWQLNQDVPFPPPPDLTSVRVMVNQYEANRRGGYYRGDELFFGPSNVFSENCGGIEVLAPGEAVTCTLENVPLIEPAGLSAGVNEVYVDSLGEGGRVRFTCE